MEAAGQGGFIGQMGLDGEGRGTQRGARQEQLALLWKQEGKRGMECGLELDRLGSITSSDTYRLCDLG